MSVDKRLFNARKGLKVAERILFDSYAIADDPKLFLSVSEDIYFALIEVVTAFFELLEKDNILSNYINNKTILNHTNNKILNHMGNTNIEVLFRNFKEVSQRFKFKDVDFKILDDINKIIQDHKNSPVEFIRDESLVICDDKYKYNRLNMDIMKKILFDARTFLEKVANVVESITDGRV